MSGSRTSKQGRDRVAGNEQETYECDVLVVGSGASGMSAAVTAGHPGLNVLIVEKEPLSAARPRVGRMAVDSRHLARQGVGHRRKP